jgi:hypothetical protein
MIDLAWSPEFAAKLVDQGFGPTPRDAGSQFTITVTAYRNGIRMVNGTVVWREHPELGVQEAIAVLLTEFEKRLDREARDSKEKKQ